MNHILVPVAVVILVIGAVWSCVGWVVDNYVNSVPASISRWTLWSGIAVVAIGMLLFLWPLLFVFAFRPA